MSSNMHQIALRIDWELLRRQKKWLFEHQFKHSAQGLLSLIDAIQDAALLDHIADEQTIFGKPTTEGISNDR